MTGTSDVAVIGAGIVGLCAAHQLAARGLSVTVYEVGEPGSGQSAGQSRIFRHAHDDPRLVELVVRSLAMWREWEDEFGVELVSRDGCLALGDAAVRRLDVMSRYPQIGARAVDEGDLQTLLPALADYDGPAIFDPSGGSIRTQQAVAALSAPLAGRLVHEQVISVEQSKDAVRVRCPTSLSEHGALVVCAGRGTAAITRGVGMRLPIALGAHVRVSFALREPVSTLPTLQDGSGAFGFSGVYAAAYPDGSAYGLGMAGSVDADNDGTITDTTGFDELTRQPQGYVARALPGFDPTPRDVVHCWVTRLPWGDDGVGIWKSGQVYALAGHNLFKHAPVLGEALTESVVTQRVPDPFGPEHRLGAEPDAG